MPQSTSKQPPLIMLLFDAHNHIHLGSRGVAPLLEAIPTLLPSVDPNIANATFAGAAIMSTHPRDYKNVNSVVKDLRKRNFKAAACYGIHPWFLNEVLLDPQSTQVLDDGEEVWLHGLRKILVEHPDAIVGEIGLDGARWVKVAEDSVEDDIYDNDTTSSKKSIWERRRALACPMDLQKDAFVKQLLLAAELNRPVSIHVVKAWGELFSSLNEVRETMKQRHQQKRVTEPSVKDTSSSPRRNKEVLLPPKIYFHAFSGKSGVIPSILSACAKGNIDPNSDVYFGFAPAIPNFYAPKTSGVMKEIGLNRLLLETDLEDASNAWDDLLRCLEGIADALDVDVTEVADQTYVNAKCFYSSSFKTTERHGRE